MAKLRITLIKSSIGYPEEQKRTVEALGLRRMNQSIEHPDSGSIRGMLTKVRHLVKVEITGYDRKTATHRRTKRVPAEEKSA